VRYDFNWKVGAKNDRLEELEQILSTMAKYGEMKV
jgi:hypothetical protein